LAEAQHSGREQKRRTLPLESLLLEAQCCALEQITTLQWQSPLLQRGMNPSLGEIPLLQPEDLRSGESA